MKLSPAARESLFGALQRRAWDVTFSSTKPIGPRPANHFHPMGPANRRAANFALKAGPPLPWRFMGFFKRLGADQFPGVSRSQRSRLPRLEVCPVRGPLIASALANCASSSSMRAL